MLNNELSVVVVAHKASFQWSSVFTSKKFVLTSSTLWPKNSLKSISFFTTPLHFAKTASFSLLDAFSASSDSCKVLHFFSSTAYSASIKLTHSHSYFAQAMSSSFSAFIVHTSSSSLPISFSINFSSVLPMKSQLGDYINSENKKMFVSNST